MRRIMDEWKAAGRASRRTTTDCGSGSLAAREVFFSALGPPQRRRPGVAANLQAKLGLLEEAEALLPVDDVDAARAAYRDIADRWEDIGMVSRSTISESRAPAGDRD